MRIQCRNLTSQARRICSNKILPASDHRWVFSFPSSFSLSTPCTACYFILRSWSPDGAVRIPMQEAGPQSKPPISIPSMFSDTVER